MEKHILQDEVNSTIERYLFSKSEKKQHKAWLTLLHHPARDPLVLQLLYKNVENTLPQIQKDEQLRQNVFRLLYNLPHRDDKHFPILLQLLPSNISGQTNYQVVHIINRLPELREAYAAQLLDYICAPERTEKYFYWELQHLTHLKKLAQQRLQQWTKGPYEQCHLMALSIIEEQKIPDDEALYLFEQLLQTVKEGSEVYTKLLKQIARWGTAVSPLAPQLLQKMSLSKTPAEQKYLLADTISCIASELASEDMSRLCSLLARKSGPTQVAGLKVLDGLEAFTLDDLPSLQQIVQNGIGQAQIQALQALAHMKLYAHPGPAETVHAFSLSILELFSSREFRPQDNQVRMAFLEFLVPFANRHEAIFHAVASVFEEGFVGSTGFIAYLFSNANNHSPRCFTMYLRQMRGNRSSYPNFRLFRAAWYTMPHQENGLERLFQACFAEDSQYLKLLVKQIAQSPKLSKEWLVPFLLEQLHNSAPILRQTAARILGHCKDKHKALVPALLQRLSVEKHTQTMYTLIAALGHFEVHAKEAIQPLLELLKEYQPVLWPAIMNTLGHIGQPAKSTAVELLPFVEESKTSVRKSCLHNLGKLSNATPQVLKALTDALSAPKRVGQVIAARSLWQLHPLTEQAQQALQEAFKSSHSKARWYAGLAWGSSQPITPIEELLRALQADTPAEEARLGTILSHPGIPAPLKIQWVEKKGHWIIHCYHAQLKAISRAKSDKAYMKLLQHAKESRQELLAHKINYLKGVITFQALQETTGALMQELEERFATLMPGVVHWGFAKQLEFFGPGKMRGDKDDLVRACEAMTQLSIQVFRREPGTPVAQSPKLTLQKRYQRECRQLYEFIQTYREDGTLEQFHNRWEDALFT